MMMINALPFVSLCTAYPFISLLFIHLFDGVPFDYRFDFLHIFLENMPNLFFRIYFFPFLPFASILNNTLNFHLAIISCFSGVGPNVKHVSSLIWRLTIAINNDIYIQYIGPLPPKQSLVWYIYIYISDQIPRRIVDSGWSHRGIDHQEPFISLFLSEVAIPGQSI